MGRPVNPTPAEFLHAAGEVTFTFTLDGRKTRTSCAENIARRVEVPLSKALDLLAELEEKFPGAAASWFVT